MISHPPPSLLHQQTRERYHDDREVRVVRADASSRRVDSRVSVHGAEHPLERRFHQVPRRAVGGAHNLGEGRGRVRGGRGRERRVAIRDGRGRGRRGGRGRGGCCGRGARVDRGEDASQRLDALATQLDVAPADERLDEVEGADVDVGGVDGLRAEGWGGASRVSDRDARVRVGAAGGCWVDIDRDAGRGSGGRGDPRARTRVDST